MNLRLASDDPVWYAAYGSNLHAARFDCYICGGRPHGASRTYAGCRDQTPPRKDIAIRLAGGLHFGRDSSVWGGGMAFYDPHADGELAARAYLLTFGQLTDVVAQEVRRPVGSDLQTPNSGAYETLLGLQDREGIPMFTLTTLQDLEPTPPSAPYLRVMLDGLDEAFGWSAHARAEYLVSAPGVAPAWSVNRLVELCDGA